MLQRLFIVLLTVVLVIPVCAQTDEDILRAIVGKYFDAYGRKDWAAMAAFWQKDSPSLGQRYRALQRQFADSELSFSDLVISRIRIEKDRASLRVSVKRSATMKERNSIVITRVSAEMSFVKENDQWLLWNETSALNSLLDALAGAGTDDERRKLLDEDNELVTREMLFLLSGQSDRAYTQADYVRALSLLKSVVLVAEHINNRNELANAWHNIGIIHFVRNNFGDALDAYRRSLKIEEELDRRYEIARSLNSIALVYLAQANFAESLTYFQRALTIYESLDRKYETAQTLENIGNLYYEQGDFVRSVDYYQQSLKQLDANKRAVPAAHRVLKIARVEYEQGHDIAAIEFYRQAIDRLAAAGDRRSLGYAFHSLANVLYEQGDYNQALAFYNRGLLAEREAGTREGEAGALQGIGLIHTLNGNYQLALEAYQQNLTIALALDKKADLAVAWQKVGGSFFSLGKLDEAMAAYQQALTLREQIGDSQETALALIDVGVTLSAKRDFTGALEHYAKSRELYERAGNLAGISATLLNTSLVHYLQGDFLKAIEVAGNAAEYAKRADDPDLFWQSRHRAGKAYFRLNDMAAARKALTEAITTIETMRAPASRAQQPRYYETKVAPYLTMVDVAISEGQGNEAYNFSQRAKNRVLTGLLQNVRSQIVKTMSAREQDRERQLLSEITTTNAQLYREQEREKPRTGRIIELKSRLQKAQATYSDFRAKLYALRPQLKTLRGEIKPITVEQAVSLAGDSKTGLLEFVETDEHIYLFVFAKEPSKARRGKTGVLSPILKIFMLETTRGDLFARVSQFNQAITDRDESVNQQARELYDLLLKPAQAALEGKTQLIIAPDAVSWGLPFQALRGVADRYLIEDFAISYTPSLTIFNAVSHARFGTSIRASARQTKPLSLLIVANPVLSQDVTTRIKTAMGGAQVVPLMENEKDIAEIKKFYRTEQSISLSGKDATEDRIKVEMREAHYIHFAVRGIHHEASPLFSLLTATPNPEAKEDGLIELRELLRMDMKAELVVMSETEWGVPRALSNRAMTAWTWAWFVAGSKEELISNWKTDSTAATELMVEFYRQLSENRARFSKAVIWHGVVQNWLSRQTDRHPYYWAGFIMLGNGK